MQCLQCRSWCSLDLLARVQNSLLFSMFLLGPLSCNTHAMQVRSDSVYQVRLPLSSGRLVDFADAQGKVLMVDFFTTWSQASNLATKNYSILFAKYREQGLFVIGVALDELGQHVVEPFRVGMQISYPIALADRNIVSGESYFGRIDVLPTLLVFDRQGRLAKAFMGLVPFRVIEQVVQDLL